MNKEEIKHFKSLLKQGSLRHMNILLDSAFQKELLTIIKDYEKLQQENEKQKEVIDKAREELKKGLHELDTRRREEVYIEQYIEEALNMLKEVPE